MAIVNNLVMQLDGQNIVVYPYTVGRAVYINESNGYNLIQALADLRNNAISEWSQILNKPFASIGSDFKVVDGRLQLNGSLSMEWNDIQNKPQTFNTTWSKISGVPETFHSSWDDIDNKPSYYPSNWGNIYNKPDYYQAEWNHITNRPENFDTTWNDVKDKPNLYPTNWEMVENRPEDFASTWDDVKNKPFETLDENTLMVDNGILSVLGGNSFNFINQNVYNNLVTTDKNYYVVCNFNFNNTSDINIVDPNVFVLPYLSNINKFMNIHTTTYNNFDGFELIPGYVKYNATTQTLTSGNRFGQQQFIYFNSNIDYLMYNAQGGVDFDGLYNTSRITSANYAFANMNIKATRNNFSIDKITLNVNNCIHMFENLYYYNNFAFYFYNYSGLAGFNLTEKYMFDGIHCNNADNYYTYLRFSWMPPSVSETRQTQLQFYLNNANGYWLNFSAETDSISGSVFSLNNCYFNGLNVAAQGGIFHTNFYLNNIRSVPLYLSYSMNIIENISIIGENGIRALYTYGVRNNLNLNLNNIRFTDGSYVYLEFDTPQNLYLIGKMNTSTINLNAMMGNYWTRIQNWYIGSCFENMKLNTVPIYMSLNGVVNYDSSLTLDGTFKHTVLQNGAVLSYMPLPQNINRINIPYAFYNTNYTGVSKIFRNVIDATYAYAGCINLTNVILPMQNKDEIYAKVKDLTGTWCGCPNLTNIIGGGDYDATNQIIYAMNNLVTMNYAFLSSNLLADVEFNLFVFQPCNAVSIFGSTPSSYTANKKIHVLAGSDLDIKSLTEPYFISNNPSLNAENITILDNGRCFEEYHLYIYNDIDSPVYFFRNIYGTSMLETDPTVWDQVSNTLINNVIFTNETFDNTGSDIITLGPWDQAKDNKVTMAYFNSSSNIIYLTQNPQKTTKRPTYLNYLRDGSIYSLNVKEVDYLNDIIPFTFNAGKDYYLYQMFYNSKVTNAINITKWLNTLNNQSSTDIDVNAPIQCTDMYNNCFYLTNINEALDNRINNTYAMFKNCVNLVNQFNSPVDFIFGCNHYEMFNNCKNLSEPLITVGVGLTPSDYSYMYVNCCNLKNGYIGSDANRIYNTFYNCINMKNLIYNFNDINSWVYNQGTTYSEYTCYNCQNLENIKIIVNYEASINAPIYWFNSYQVFYNCRFLVYQPFMPLNYFCLTNIGICNNCSNFVVMQIGNTCWWHNNTLKGMASQSLNYINGSYDYTNVANNIAVASVGNGYFWTSDHFNGMKNLIIAAMPEYTTSGFASYGGGYEVYSWCRNLLFGRLPHVENVGNLTINYNNCNNLLVTEISEDRLKYIIKSFRNDNSVRQGLSPQSLYYGYHNCYNLVVARFPREFSNFYYTFNNCYNLRYVQLGDFGDSRISYAFDNCYNLDTVLVGDNMINIQGSFNHTYNLNNFIGANHLLFMYGSFNNSGIPKFDITLDRFDKLMAINWSFNNACNITEVNINHPNVQMLSGLFWNCHNIKKVNIDMRNHINNINTTLVNQLFNDCSNLETVIIKGLTNMHSTQHSGSFGNCYNIRNIYLEGTPADSGVPCILPMFSGSIFYNGCLNLEYLEITESWLVNTGGNFSFYGSYCNSDNLTINISNAVFTFNVNTENNNSSDIGYQFFGCQSLKQVIGNVNTTLPLTNIANMCTMSQSRTSVLLEPIGITETNYITNMSGAYYNCQSLRNAVCYSNINTMCFTYYNCFNLTTAVCGPNVQNMLYAYYNCFNLTTAACGPNVLDMTFAYDNCYNLTTAVCGENVQNMAFAYINCYNLTTAACSDSVEDMIFAYNNCHNLIEAVCGNNVLNLMYTYENCYNLVNAVCGPNVINMNFAYRNCTNLTHSVCGDNVIGFVQAFEGCTNIADVNIGPNVVYAYGCYKDCLQIPNNIFINSKVLQPAPCLEYRSNVNLDIHIYENSIWYNVALVDSTNPDSVGGFWTGILLNSPSKDPDNYNVITQHDVTNRRFYWLQPNVQLNIYYDLID